MENNKKILLKGLTKFVEEGNIKKVRFVFEQFHPSDIYEETKNWKVEKTILLLRLLKEDDASDFFSEINPKKQTEIINLLSKEEVAELFEEMYTDEAIDILEDLPQKIMDRVINNADEETRGKINKILRYDKSKNGYHMVVDFISIPHNITIKEAKKEIKSKIKNDDLEIVGNIFVHHNKTEDFFGLIKPDDIFAHEDDEKIEKYITNVKPLFTNDHILESHRSMSKYDIPSMPILNKKNKLVGVVEAEDIIEKFEEAGELALEQSAVTSLGKPYLESNIKDIVKSRAPWIIVLLIIGSFSQIIITGFQLLWQHYDMFNTVSQVSEGIALSGIATLAVTTALSVSSSINDTAGNVGSQTSSTLVRAIALGEIGAKGTYWKALKKEFITSVIIGTIIMVVSFIRIITIWAIFGYFGHYSPKDDPKIITSYLMLIAFVGSLSFFITIVIGNLVGASLPMLAHKYGIDGAIFSGPVQTTIVDITTLLVYFSLTSAIFIPLGNYLKDTDPTSIIKMFAPIINNNKIIML